MITIHLTDIRFFDYHGILPEEKILGSYFILNAEISFIEKDEIIHSIKQTIDYGTIFNIIQQRMAKPTPLLESLVMDIGTTIKTEFEEITGVKISLKKLNPPITGLQGSVGVTWQKEY